MIRHSPLILTAGRGSLAAARRLKEILPEARLAIPGPRPSADTIGYESLAGFLPASFLAGHPLIWIGAAAIPIRLLGPFLGDKADEPPLIVLNDSLTQVIPLLGGHHGGHRLARRIAQALKVTSAVTSWSENRLGVALDDPPPGWILANPQHYRSIAGRIAAGEIPRITGSIPWLEGVFEGRSAGRLRIVASLYRRRPRADTLHYIPRTLAVGVGCSRGAKSRELITRVQRVLDEHGWDRRGVAGVFSIDLKIDEPAVHALAEDLDVPARFFSARRLDRESGRVPHPSPVVRAATGTASVAESAALIAAGEGGSLIAAKRRSANVTVAIGRSREPIDPTLHGRGRGRLDIVGLGPGGEEMRSLQCHRALLEAEEIVGYRGYIEGLDPRMIRAKRLYPFELGQEEERARHALNRAARGRRVALVSSGDPSIYAMAGVVFEVLERENAPRWRRAAIRVLPGISALQAASAAAGAMIGHDFCALSLSDLRTDFARIERRLIAAIDGDFIIALYNPLSRTRRRPFARALELLQSRLEAETPVLIVRHAGRPQQEVRIIDLRRLAEERIDMHTIVLIGSRATRLWRDDRGWLYTPRSGIPRNEAS